MIMALGRATRVLMGAARAQPKRAASADSKLPATEKRKRKAKTGGIPGLNIPCAVSPAMKEFFGVSEIPRSVAIKKIWQYIKENNLQNPANKREIICDEKLKSIFGGKEFVGFLDVSPLMNSHFVKK